MSDILKPPKLGSTIGSTLGKQTKNVALAGKQSITAKAPKLKKPADAFAPPSVFFGKSESFEGPKHPNIRNLWNFMNKHHKSK